MNDPGDQKQKGRKVKNSSSGYASIPKLAIQLTCYGYARVCMGGGGWSRSLKVVLETA